VEQTIALGDGGSVGSVFRNCVATCKTARCLNDEDNNIILFAEKISDLYRE